MTSRPSALRRLDLGAIDLGAIGRGAAVAVAVGAAAGLVARIADVPSDDGSSAALALLAVTLAGLTVAGWVAARSCRRAPLVHGAAASLAAVAALAVVNLIREAAGDDDVRWSYLAVWALLAAASGIAGGLLGLRGPHRRASGLDGDDPPRRADSRR